jgi:hypothetical protein
MDLYQLWWILAGLGDYGRAIFVAMVVLACTDVGIINIWSVTSKTRWMFRAAIVLGSILLPSVIDGWDIVFVFLVQSTVFYGIAIALTRNVAGREECASSSREHDASICLSSTWLSSRAVLGTVASTAIVVGLLFCMPIEVWKEWKCLSMLGVAFGVSTALAYWTVFFVKSVKWRFVIGAMYPIAIPIIGFQSVVAAAFCQKRASWKANGESNGANTSLYPHLLPMMAAIIGELLFLPPALFFTLVLARLSLLDAKTVNAVAYGSLISQGEELERIIPETDVNSHAVSESQLLARRKVLKAVRAELGAYHEARSPQLAYDCSRRMNAFLRLNMGLRAEADLAKEENRRADEVDICLDIIRLGHAAVAGGTAFDIIVDYYIEPSGLKRLQGIADYIDLAKRRDTIDVIESAINRQESLETMIVKDSIWGSRPFVWRGCAVDTIMRITTHEPVPQQNLRGSCYKIRDNREELLLELRWGKEGEHP